MTDVETQKRLTISTDGENHSYLMVPLEQLGEVITLLKCRSIFHRVLPDAVGLDGRPVIAFVDFGLRADAARIQKLLDEA